MIPLKDNIPSRTVPLVNYAIIALMALAFLAQLREAGQPHPVLVERYGMIPRRVLQPGAEILVREVVALDGLPEAVERPARRRRLTRG